MAATLTSATTTPPPSPANLTDADAKIYISRATLQLKQNFDKYEWHTRVITSSPEPDAYPTPESEAEVQEVVDQRQVRAGKQQQKQPQLTSGRSEQRSGPPNEMRDGAQTLTGLVDNFMDAERYHSVCNSINRNESSASRQTSRI